MIPRLQWLHPKNDDRSLVSATFHMITITLISMSMAGLTWFTLSSDFPIPDVTLSQFFWFGYTTVSSDYSDGEYVNSTIVNLMRTTILLCFMAIIFSLFGFILDITVLRSLFYRMMRKYALLGTCTVLWIMAIISLSYYIVLLLGNSLDKIDSNVDTMVSYGFGFYLLAAAGGISLVGVFYNLLLSHSPSRFHQDDDRCLIDGFDDGLDTFNSPTPPPPYNVLPPPYTP